MALCHRRTELRDGDFPPLTAAEQQNKAEFVGLLGRLGELAGSSLTVAAPAPELVFKKAFSSDDDY